MPIEELEKVSVSEAKLEMEVFIGTKHSSEMRDQTFEFLKANLDTFMSSHEDMVGIYPEIACHRLNMDQEIDIAKKEKVWA